MKKLSIIAGSLLLSNLSQGQSLFADNFVEDGTTPLPLRFSVKAGIGYDDKYTTTSALASVKSAYIHAALGADYVNYTPKTSWKVGAEVSANKYLKSSSGNNGIYYNGRLNLNLNHRLTQRTRYVQRSYVSYGIEPNYSFSFTPNRAPSEHLFYSTDHAIGHRWTNRLATYTGFKVNGVDYTSSTEKANNRRTYTFYNNFRYSVGPKTIMTANFSYAKTEASGAAGDATDIGGGLGVEHRINHNSYVNAQIGATYRSVEGGKQDYYSPYIKATYNASLNNKTKIRTYATYGIENYGTSFATSTFDTNQSIRIGTELSYLISPRFTLRGGVNYIRSNFSDGRDVSSSTAIGNENQTLINPYVGFSYSLNDRTTIDGSYHYNTSSSSFSNSADRDYERNRFQFEVSRIF